MRTIFLLLLLASIPGITGCAGAIVRSMCAANSSEKSLAARHYETRITVSTSTGASTSHQSFKCTPSGYYCGGGEWHPNFPPVSDSGFRYQLPQGEFQIALPACGALERAGQDWTPLSDWPISHLRIGGEKYVFSAGELQHKSSIIVAGVHVDNYVVRRVPVLE